MENLSKSIPSEYETTKGDVNIDTMLAKINFTELRTAFLDTVKNLGIANVQDQDINFVGKEQINNKGMILALATYDVESNTIGLNRSEIEKFSKEKTETEQLLEFLHTIIHEECHAISKREVNILIKDHPILITFRRCLSKRTGYHTVEKTVDQQSQEKFEFLNEAVVEKLSYNIMREYIKRINVKGDVESFLQQRTNTAPYWTSNITMIESLVQLIAKAKKIQGEEVWKELFIGLIKGKYLFTDPLTYWCNKLLGKDFIEQLAFLDQKTDVIKMMNKIKKASSFIDKVYSDEQKTI